ncbi:MAG: twin-arginine translocase subunit TatC [Cytophagales bacterium]|nr:twin-arginine translocase subunit TatC [Cytophagales bacterium]MDW8383758.1 twin-arginine translocase subunit TatC [Flammeovirgaceae bacterium]
MNVDKEMSFLDHLEELRWHLIRSIIAILIFTVAAFFSKYYIFHVIIFGPSRPDFITYRVLCKLSEYFQTPALCINSLPFTLQSRTMTGQFTMHITSSVVVGLICAFPYVFWEIWRFVKPGLYPHEQRVSRYATFFVSFLFLSGVLFGYFIITPISINFLVNYQIDESIRNDIDIISYIQTIIMIVLACGVMFQLPIVVYFLSKIGIVTPALMKNYFRHAVVIILIVSAVITPPDVFSQILVALPVTILYAFSILISAKVQQGLEKEEAELAKRYASKAFSEKNTLQIKPPANSVNRQF